MRAYFGMLAHYITDDWKLECELLSFDELEGSHTGENQAAHMYGVLKEFGILGKVGQLFPPSFTILINRQLLSSVTSLETMYLSMIRQCMFLPVHWIRGTILHSMHVNNVSSESLTLSFLVIRTHSRCGKAASNM